MRALLVAIALAGCAPAAAPPKPMDAPPGIPAAQINAPAAPVFDTSWPTSVVGGEQLSCTGHAVQGGFVICKTEPGARVIVHGGGSSLKPESEQTTAADAQGYAVIGFDRDAKGVAHIEAKGANIAATIDVEIAPREFSVQHVDGLPPDTVNPSNPAVLARIAHEAELKNVGFSSRAPVDGFEGTWVWPVEGRISGLWGNQRVDNGVPKTPHYGVDIAGPIGSQIRAPADGVVSFVNPDMFLEGGLVLVDHGQGLISMYLHMSRVDVKVGDHIKQGDPIGARGALGRATGPHLCWRLKWRDRYLDPSLMPLTPVKPQT